MNFHPMKTTVQELQELKPGQVGAIKRIYESFGTGSDGVGRVAKAFHISDSAAAAMATAIKESKSPPNSVTEAAPVPDPTAAAIVDAHSARASYLAGNLARTVNKAAAKPIGDCSIQELEALAAAVGSDAGMFGA